MRTGALARRVDRVRAELERAFAEEHTPREVAASFGFGLFVTALPTLGAGFLVFLAAVAVTDRVSKVALFASVLVLNPAVKWGVYAGSYWLGTLLLGPPPAASGGVGALSYDAGPEVVVRLLAGNLVVAVVAGVVGYVVAHRLVVAYRRREADVVERVVEEYVAPPEDAVGGTDRAE